MKLVIVRHGKYGDNGNLTKEGREETNSLAKNLEKEISGTHIVILSSTIPRAMQTAEIIGKVLGVTVQGYDVLQTSVDCLYKKQEVMGLVRSMQAETLVIVTHSEYTYAIPRWFLWGCGKTTIEHCREIDKNSYARIVTSNSCYIIDYAGKETERLTVEDIKPDPRMMR